MSEHQPDPTEDANQQESGQGDTKDHPTGGLSPAPTTPTDEKRNPEAGTGSADKRSPDSPAEQDEPPSTGPDAPGAAGGDITR
jgi:hypothetical protein